MSDTYCPICGRKTDGLVIAAPGVPVSQQHRCPPKTLRGIDATMPVERQEGEQRSFGRRLAEGFAMLNDSDD